jgi:hypothetical protein
MHRPTQVNFRRLLQISVGGILAVIGSCSDPLRFSPNTPANAAVTFYAVGSPGSAPTPLATLTTDSSGGINLSESSFTCQQNQNALVYAVLSGGSGTESLLSSANATNTSIELMAALGPCSSVPAKFYINELTTIAAVYALNAFRAISDAIPLGDMTQLSGSSPAINNAFATAALLADVTTGQPAASLPVASYCSIPSAPINCFGLERLTALANALSNCVRTATGSAPCTQLFDATGASNTLDATLFIARNPGMANGISDIIYNLSAQNPVIALIPPNANILPLPLYAPGLSAVPTDWTISLNFSPPNYAEPEAIAIDASGNVWSIVVPTSTQSPASTGSRLVGLGPTGTPLTGSPYVVSEPLPGAQGPLLSLAFDQNNNVWIANYQLGVVTVFSSRDLPLGENLPIAYFMYDTQPGEMNPTAIAISGSGDAWLANGNWTVTALSSSAAPLAGSPYTGIGLDAPTSIAIDGKNNVWVANSSASVTALNSSGTPLPGSPYTGGGLTGVGGQTVGQGIAIDNSGNVWIINNNSSVTALNSSGAPLPGSPYAGGGLSGAIAIAIDGAGNAWVASNGPYTNDLDGGYSSSRITELLSGGGAASPGSGFTAGFINTPTGIAIDGAGDVWVINDSFNADPATAPSGAGPGVTEFIGVAAPTVTPLAVQIHTNPAPPPPPPPPPTTYTVGGTVTGLPGGLILTLTLQGTDTDSLVLAANGSFVFAAQIATGGTYNVIATVNPATVTCTVTNGSGVIGSANITNVAVTC